MTQQKLNMVQSKRKAKPRAPRAARATPFTYHPPSSQRAVLTWSGVVGLAEGAAGNGIARVYRLNGAYDVDSGVGSTSTPGFAEYAAFFTNYRVWRASVRVVGTASGGSAGSLATIVMYPNATNTYLSGAGAGPAWSVAPFAVKQTVRADSTGAKTIAVLTKKYDLPAIARITKSQYRNDMDYSATTTTIPTRYIGLAVGGYGVGSSNTVTFTFQVYVSMQIEFFNPIQISV